MADFNKNIDDWCCVCVCVWVGKYINIPVGEQRLEESPLLQHSLKPGTEQGGASTVRMAAVIHLQLDNQHPLKRNTQYRATKEINP